MAQGEFFSNIYDEVGGGAGVLRKDGKDITVFSLKFKTISPLSKHFSAFLLSERSSYHNEKDNDVYSTGMMALGLTYHPWEHKEYLSFSLGGGWAQNMNYSTLLDNFWESFTFGTGFYGGISYQLTPKWNAELSYANYHFTKSQFDAQTLLGTLTYTISLKAILEFF